MFTSIPHLPGATSPPPSKRHGRVPHASRLLRFLALCALIAIVPERSASAQPAGPEFASRELVVALLRAFNVDNDALRNARAGDGFPLGILPAGARVLGAFDTGDGNPTTYVAFAYGYSAAVDSLRHRLLSTGWRPADLAEPFVTRGTGVNVARGGRGSGPLLSTYHCTTGDSLRVDAARPTSRTVMTFTHFRSQSDSGCAPRNAPAVQRPAASADDSVSADLVNVLFWNSGIGLRGGVSVGAAAAGVDSLFDAPDVSVLGSALFGFGSVTIAASGQPPEQLLEGISTRALRMGFTLRPASPDATAAREGFQPLMAAPAAAAALCRAAENLIVSGSRKPSGGSLVTLMHARSESNNCGAAPPPTAGAPRASAPIPSLTSPAGGYQKSLGHSRTTRGGVTIRYSVQGTIRSGLSAEALLRHYADQLRAQGWRNADSSAAPAGPHRFTYMAAGGMRWAGELVAQPQRAPSILVDMTFSARMDSVPLPAR